MGLKHVVEGKVDRHDEHTAANQENGYVPIVPGGALVEPHKKVSQTEGHNDANKNVLVNDQSHYEEDDGQCPQYKDGARQSLPKQREQKTGKHQCRTGVVLQENECGRDKKQGKCRQFGTEITYLHTYATHQFRQCQRCAHLGEFGGLQLKGTQVKPRLASVGTLTHKQYRNQQQYHSNVDDIGYIGKNTGFEHHYHQSGKEGNAHPYNLLAMLAG